MITLCHLVNSAPIPTIFSLSRSLSLSQTHAYTHTHSLFLSLSLSPVLSLSLVCLTRSTNQLAGRVKSAELVSLVDELL